MKFIYIFILFNFSSNCYTQTLSSSLNNTFILKGEVTGRSKGRMILNYQDSTNVWIHDTTWLKNGKFSFKGFINQPTLGILGDPKYVNGREVNSVRLFLEPKQMTVKLTEGDYESADLKGSGTQEDYNVFLKQKNEVEIKLDSITDKFDKLSTIYNSDQRDSIGKIIIDEKLDQIRIKMNKEYQEIENIFLPIPSQILINREGVIIWKKTFNKETDSKSLNSLLLEIFIR